MRRSFAQHRGTGRSFGLRTWHRKPALKRSCVRHEEANQVWIYTISWDINDHVSSMRSRTRRGRDRRLRATHRHEEGSQARTYTITIQISHVFGMMKETSVGRVWYVGVTGRGETSIISCRRHDRFITPHIYAGWGRWCVGQLQRVPMSEASSMGTAPWGQHQSNSYPISPR
jgi:hypothetical protein